MTIKLPKKNTYIVLAAVAFVLVILNLIPKKTTNVVLPVSEPVTSTPLPTTTSLPSKSTRPIPSANADSVPNLNSIREISVQAKQFEFTPNPIKVKLGETVRLKITSLDVAHGFALPDFGIDEFLEPGKTVVVEFQATQKGEFSFFCSVACGEGHSGMRGTLIVE